MFVKHQASSDGLNLKLEVAGRIKGDTHDGNCPFGVTCPRLLYQSDPPVRLCIISP